MKGSAASGLRATRKNLSFMKRAGKTRALMTVARTTL
jgi:hypothetical protein